MDLHPCATSHSPVFGGRCGFLWFLLATFALDLQRAGRGMGLAPVCRQSGPVRIGAGGCGILLFAVLLVPAASAFGGAAVLGIRGADYWLAWERWFLGDALTQLVVTPAILYWIFGTSWNARMPDAKRRIEGGLLAVGLVVTAYLASNTTIRSLDFSESLFYAPVPFLFWAAIRFGMAGASGAVTVVAFFAVELPWRAGARLPVARLPTPLWPCRIFLRGARLLSISWPH